MLYTLIEPIPCGRAPWFTGGQQGLPNDISMTTFQDHAARYERCAGPRSVPADGRRRVNALLTRTGAARGRRIVHAGGLLNAFPLRASSVRDRFTTQSLGPWPLGHSKFSHGVSPFARL